LSDYFVAKRPIHHQYLKIDAQLITEYNFGFQRSIIRQIYLDTIFSFSGTVIFFIYNILNAKLKKYQNSKITDYNI
jgi:hypothetical protein